METRHNQRKRKTTMESTVIPSKKKSTKKKVSPEEALLGKKTVKLLDKLSPGVFNNPMDGIDPTEEVTVPFDINAPELCPWKYAEEQNNKQSLQQQVVPEQKKRGRGRPAGSKNKIQKPKPIVDPTLPKRGRGRPAGSKNKIQKPKPIVDPTLPKRGRGRPKGSGTKQSSKNIFMPSLPTIDKTVGTESPINVIIPVTVTENKIQRIEGYVCVICNNKKQATTIQNTYKVGRRLDMHPTAYNISSKTEEEYAQPFMKLGKETGVNWVHVSYEHLSNKNETFTQLFNESFPMVAIDSNWAVNIQN